MKLFIPEIGTVLKLEADWEFSLFVETRNEALVTASDFPRDTTYRWSLAPTSKEAPKNVGWEKQASWSAEWRKNFILPAGSILTVDRIYIRKGVKDFSSLSFNLNRKSVNADHSKFAKNLATQKGRCRFWAKLADVNNIEFSAL